VVPRDGYKGRNPPIGRGIAALGMTSRQPNTKADPSRAFGMTTRGWGPLGFARGRRDDGAERMTGAAGRL